MVLTRMGRLVIYCCLFALVAVVYCEQEDARERRGTRDF